jgi:hypothetical protein
MKDIFAYKVIVWHNDCVNGTHHSIKATGATPEQALKEFSKYLERPAQFRSFTSKNKVQLHGPKGFMFDIIDLA